MKIHEKKMQNFYKIKFRGEYLFFNCQFKKKMKNRNTNEKIYKYFCS